VTPAFPWTASGSDLAALLEDLDTVGSVEVTKSVVDAVATFTVQSTDGTFPYNAFVEATGIDSGKTTNVDTDTAGNDGLRTGVYQDKTGFVIESRDAFSNRVYAGPTKEVQVIETLSEDDLTGSFTVGYNRASVEVAAQAGIASMRAALESLPSLGSVAVSTHSARQLTPLKANLTGGSPYVQFAEDPSSTFIVGDWIRLSNEFTGPCTRWL
jgi:hypothetical protein